MATRYPRAPLPAKRAKMPLLVSQTELLRAWGRDLYRMFGAMPYHVGSSLTTQTFRDVDVRTMLRDDLFDDLAARVHLTYLHTTVSLWGQQVTGLPIDFQIQRQSEANAEYGRRPRNPIGLSADALDHDDDRRVPDSPFFKPTKEVT